MKTKTIPYIVILLAFLFANKTFAQETEEIKKTEETEKTKEPKKEKKKRKKKKKKKIVKRVRKIPKKKKYQKKKVRNTPYVIEEDPDFYSVFTDFRIPVRDDINESDLLYEGWVTEEARYAFRCRKKKRVRLTFWQLVEKDGKLEGSEFINVTPENEKCLKSDIEFAHKPPKAEKVVPPKKTKEIAPKTEKETKTTKFKKDLDQKKKKKWSAPKK